MFFGQQLQACWQCCIMMQHLRQGARNMGWPVQLNAGLFTQGGAKGCKGYFPTKSWKSLCRKDHALLSVGLWFHPSLQHSKQSATVRYALPVACGCAAWRRAMKKKRKWKKKRLRKRTCLGLPVVICCDYFVKIYSCVVQLSACHVNAQLEWCWWAVQHCLNFELKISVDRAFVEEFIFRFDRVVWFSTCIDLKLRFAAFRFFSFSKLFLRHLPGS